MDVAWSRARPDEKHFIHWIRKFTLGDRYLHEGLLPLREFVRFRKTFISLTLQFLYYHFPNSVLKSPLLITWAPVLISWRSI